MKNENGKCLLRNIINESDEIAVVVFLLNLVKFGEIVEHAFAEAVGEEGLVGVVEDAVVVRRLRLFGIHLVAEYFEAVVLAAADAKISLRMLRADHRLLQALEDVVADLEGPARAALFLFQTNFVLVEFDGEGKGFAAFPRRFENHLLVQKNASFFRSFRVDEAQQIALAGHHEFPTVPLFGEADVLAHLF